MAAHHTKIIMQSVIAADERAIAAEQKAAVAEAKLAAELRAAVAETKIHTMREELVAAKVDLARLKSDNPGPEAKADAAEEKAKVAREELAEVKSDLAKYKVSLGDWVKGCEDRDTVISKQQEDIVKLGGLIVKRDDMIRATPRIFD
jgi:hypothetical protein